MTQTQISQRKLLLSSSLNDYFLCNNCGSEKQFHDKKILQDHIKNCDKIDKEIKFHTGSKLKQPGCTNTISHFCPVCKKNYTNMSTLRYHIRRSHFNLISKTPYYQLKKVNQVWFEKVHNSDAVIEVHKTGVNSLVLRRLGKDTSIKVNDVDTNTIDLSYIYPTYKKMVKCEVCQYETYPHLLLKHKLEHQTEKDDSRLV